MKVPTAIFKFPVFNQKIEDLRSFLESQDSGTPLGELLWILTPTDYENLVTSLPDFEAQVEKLETMAQDNLTLGWAAFKARYNILA